MTVLSFMKKVRTITDIEVKDKHVFLRVDFNVPLTSAGTVFDDTRIVAALPTVQYLLDHGAKIILASHLGRPKGKKNPSYSLRPVAPVLSEKLNKPIQFLDDCIGESVEIAVQSMQSSSIVLLENLRFYPGEEQNDPSFAEKLARLAEIYVNDAFGTAHRAHASTAGVPEIINERAAGFLIENELAYLGEKTAQPERPFTVILGGAKVSDKIKVIDALLEKADQLLIGGAMAYTFSLAMGKKVGNSLCEPDKLEVALKAIEKAKAKGVKLLLPVDTLVTDTLNFENGTVGRQKIVSGDIEEGWEGVDIGPKTIQLYQHEIKSAKTILWNGPMGVFEIDSCAQGTFQIANAIGANTTAISIIGGGDSVTAVKKGGYAEKVTFISTGGGASLEFLEGKVLPGVKALES